MAQPKLGVSGWRNGPAGQQIRYCRLQVRCIVGIPGKLKVIDRAAVLKTHIGGDQKRARRLLGEPLPRQAAARIDQNRKRELSFAYRPAQFVRQSPAAGKPQPAARSRDDVRETHSDTRHTANSGSRRTTRRPRRRLFDRPVRREDSAALPPDPRG